MYEGAPTVPDGGRFWKICQSHGVTVFYTAPTAIRALMKLGDELPAQLRPEQAAPARHGRRAHQSGSVDVVSPGHRSRALPDRRHVVADRDGRDHDLAASPASFATKPGSCTRPLPGHRRRHRRARRASPSPSPTRAGCSSSRSRGRRCCARSGATTQRYVETYWKRFDNRYYVAGDGAHRDEDGCFWIMGRIDDVLNVAGHRLGTMEIESALVAHPRVAEAAVVGRPHDDQGRGGLRLRRHARRAARGRGGGALAKELRDWVGEQLGAHREARRHPLRRRAAQDALRQDHASAAALDRERRGDHAGHLDAGERSDPRSAARQEVSERMGTSLISGSRFRLRRLPEMRDVPILCKGGERRCAC